jgi:His/Glu/Gln/Arg/opine family amino acid ABC transporter permease subunit
MQIDFMIQILPRLLRALVTTIEISVVALFLGTFIGLVMGVIRTSGPKILRLIISGYVTFVRGTPIMIHIYAAYFLLPKIGLVLPAFWVGLVAMTFNTVGYQIEIIRAAIESIDRGQVEAAISIGMTKWMAMRWVIMPQVARRIIPPLTNELSSLVKASSILSVIAVLELTKVANAIIASSYKFAEVYILVSILYFAIIQILISGTTWLENNVFNYMKDTSETSQRQVA